MNEFEHFCTGHIIILIIETYFVISMCLAVRKMDDRSCSRFFKFISLLLLFCEIFQDITLISEGGDFLWFLPFQLCNLGIFVNIAAAFGKGVVRRYCAEISLVLTGPGAFFALMTPDWNYRPLLTWLPINCFFTHMLIFALPILMLIKGYCNLSFKHMWYPYVFLLVFAIPLYFFNMKYMTNYLFLRFPPEGSPLAWFDSMWGRPWYALGALAILAPLQIVIYTTAAIVRKARKKTSVPAEASA
ncbi:MAG: YwaF family protein [Clostridiales bacterium]|nr:YwaF family protein [Clostridiales bacterium]